jgi:hypothetical protein
MTCTSSIAAMRDMVAKPRNPKELISSIFAEYGETHGEVMPAHDCIPFSGTPIYKEELHTNQKKNLQLITKKIEGTSEGKRVQFNKSYHDWLDTTKKGLVERDAQVSRIGTIFTNRRQG